MAIMHPQNLNNYDPTESEKVFFDALKDQLDNSYHVFYSVKWYGTDSKGNRVNSECDFLVFSPDFGYLTIEVKGENKSKSMIDIGFCTILIKMVHLLKEIWVKGPMRRPTRVCTILRLL